MRIAIPYHFNDTDWLGGRNYFASLFSAFRAVAPPGMQMVLVLGRRTVTTLPADFPWLEVLRTPLMDRPSPAWAARHLIVRGLRRDYLLARLLKRHRIDLLSHPAYLYPPAPIKTLPWLYDFQFMHLPQYWTPSQIRALSTRFESACRFGDGLVVSSEDARRDLLAFAPWCTKPAYVLPFVSNAVDFAQLPAAAVLQQRHGLPPVYFHLANQFWSNKNHRLVIDALALLKAQGVEATVACTGKPFDARMPKYFDELMEYCRQQGVEDRFRVLGVVPHADLQGLMAHAVAVINPSRFEGWNTAVEEAKTMHKRLLLSDLPVHREQAPPLARFFAVDDSRTLAEHMIATLREPMPTPSPAAMQADYQSRLRAFGQRYLDIVADLMDRA